MSAATDSKKLWKHIYGEGTGFLCAFTGLHTPGEKTLDFPKQRFFAYPDEAGVAAKWNPSPAAKPTSAPTCSPQNVA